MAVRFVRSVRPVSSSGQFVRSVCSSRLVPSGSSGSVRPVQFVRFVVSFFISRSRRPLHLSPPCFFPHLRSLAAACAPLPFPSSRCPGGLSAACRCLLQADFLAGGRLTCLRRYLRGVLPACWGTGWGAPCSAAPLSGYSSGFGLLSGVEGWSVAPETEQGMPSASTRAPILISSPSGIFSSPCAGVSRSIV